MYNVQGRVRLLLVCVNCTVNIQNVIGVYIAQCRERLLLAFVQCTVQSETVIGVCTGHNAE